MITTKKYFKNCNCVFCYNGRDLLIEFFKKGRKFFTTNVINIGYRHTRLFIQSFDDKQAKEIINNEITYL